MATVINGATGIDKVQDGSIYPEDLVQKMTLMTAQAASGTSVDFTGIPSWVKRITVMFSEISTNGTSNIQIQIGDSGGYSAVGYRSNVFEGATAITATTGFLVSQSVAATNTRSGNVNILRLSSLTWTANGNVVRTDSGFTGAMAGSKTLSGDLDRIRITTVNGTDTFDAGTINIMYEG